MSYPWNILQKAKAVRKKAQQLAGLAIDGIMRSDWPCSMRPSTQISQITDSLYLCSARAVTEGNVRALGITCVINVTLELPFQPLGTGMEYMKIQIMDAPTSNLASHFDAVADKIWEVRRKGGRTLIHCVAGVSRSAALCMVYLIKYEGRNLREAYFYVRGRRPIVRPNVGFFRQMIEYEKRVLGKTSVAMVPNPVSPGQGLIPDLYEEEYKAALWQIQIMDAPTSNLASHFDAVADKIWEVRRKGGRTLIHCVAGVSRSAALCMVYLIKYEGRNLREAYFYVRGRRPIVRPNVGFFRQMIEYEKRVLGKTSVAMVPNPVSPGQGLIPDLYEEEYKAALWQESQRMRHRTQHQSSHSGLITPLPMRLPTRMTSAFPSSIVQQT
ncbi:unnamed protein product [Notodromas monacha]|uniref:protein-serine/threonine phosphatase n=1 Tax=Notodromas monacha TaxID=399045 RepID=A0A7R9GHZ9_9CRUS|nr:unnamed protein product [Notodromas monacha]CAG0923334.1 unnamed protein product [Notodromas monacha]